MEKSKINSKTFLFELLEYQYGYIGWCIGNDKKDEAKEYLIFAENNLDIIENLGGNESIIWSYKSAFIGFEIGITPSKAPFIGAKSQNLSIKAMNKGSHIPIVLINYGKFLVHTPSLFGGNKDDAIKVFLNAKKYMELHSEQTNKNWLYLDLIINVV